MREKLVIWGASGHARVVIDIIQLGSTYEIVGMLDDVNSSRAGSEFAGHRIIGGREQLARLRASGVNACILAFGDCSARLQLGEIARQHGFSLARAIHPRAIVAGDATIGEGSVIAAGVVINPVAQIGENVIVNTCASVDHECVIDDGAHIALGAHLAARVHVGRGSWVGIGSVVKESVRIGKATVIGAGSLVLNDIPDDALAYGSPARLVRSLSHG